MGKKTNKAAGSDTAEALKRLSRTQRPSELECDEEDFLGTTGRREVQLAHKQEAAEATDTMGFPVYPPTLPNDFTLHTQPPLSLISGPPSHPALPSGPPSLLQHHCMLFLTLLMFLSPHSHQLQPKQEVINL